MNSTKKECVQDCEKCCETKMQFIDMVSEKNILRKALDLACELMAEHFKEYYDCSGCPAHNSVNSIMYCHIDGTTKNCIKTIKQYFQQQAGMEVE